MPGARVVPAEQLRRVLGDLTRRIADSLGVEVHAAAGSTVLRAAEIPHSRREAEWALELLRGDSTGTAYALFADVRARVFLLELAATPALQPYLSDGAVAVLQDYDREHGSELTATLQAYLAALGDVSVTAARLNVHRNTIHYRLQRIRALTDLNLGDPAERSERLSRS